MNSELDAGYPCPNCTEQRRKRGTEPWPLTRIDWPDGSFILKCQMCNWWKRYLIPVTPPPFPDEGENAL